MTRVLGRIYLRIDAPPVVAQRIEQRAKTSISSWVEAGENDRPLATDGLGAPASAL